MKSAELQSILAGVLREQEQRFTQLIETLRVGNDAKTHAAQAASTPTEQRNASPPQLMDVSK